MAKVFLVRMDRRLKAGATLVPQGAAFLLPAGMEGAAHSGPGSPKGRPR